MPSLIQRSFTGGEISPALYARCDEAKFTTGLRTFRNFLLMRHGGAANRPGTNWISEVKDSTQKVRLLPFVFSDSETYVLEFGYHYIRIIQNDLYLTDLSETITGIASVAGETIVTVAANTFTGGEIRIHDVVGMTELNNRNFNIYASTIGGPGTFKLKNLDGTNVDSSGYSAYISGGFADRIYEVGTPFAVADLALIKFVQSADVMTLTHKSYNIQQLVRNSALNWICSPMIIGTSVVAPTITSVTQTGTGVALQNDYVVTAIDGQTFEESLPSNSLGFNVNAAATCPTTVHFTGAANAVIFNVYKRIGGGNGTFGFIGTVQAGTTLTFVDVGVTPDLAQVPPTDRQPFVANSTSFPNAFGNPGCCAYIEQRLTFGNQVENPEIVNMSQTGKFSNFSISLPSETSDAIQFNLAGRKVNEVRHIMDLGSMVLFTASGEFVINANNQGAIEPGNVVPAQQSYYGSSDIRPIVIGQNALYVQARGNVVRDFGYQFQTQGFQGDDLTLFSNHLFDGHTIVDWDYQQIPNSMVWAVRDDGVLLSLTYIKEQQIWGWVRHDFINNFQNGFVENVVSIPGTLEDLVYLVVRRTLNGITKRYVEKFNSRAFASVSDAVFTDSTSTYDGRNTDSTKTITCTATGDAWTSEDYITLTSSFAQFLASDVGNGINLVGADGLQVRLIIQTYVSSTVVKAYPNKTLTTEFRGVSISNWSKAIKTFKNLWHLEGQVVSIIGDGEVIASPNNDQYSTQYTVTNGSITLPVPYGVVHVGLPFVSDLETLNIDMPGTTTTATYYKKVDRVALQVQDSRGGFTGIMAPELDPANITYPATAINPLNNLYELKIRNLEAYDNPVALLTDTVEVNVATQYNTNGRLFVRQVDPVPLTVLSAIASGELPGGKNG